MTQTPVLVAGGGPTGLTLACLLHRAGVPCRVVDAAAGPTDRTRAIGVSARSLEVLDELGIADRMVARGLPSRTAIFYSRHRPVGRLTTRLARNTRFPFLLAVPQAATEAVLLDRLAELGGSVQRSTTVRSVEADGDGVSARLDTPDGPREVRAAWLVGADGSHSVVRRDAGIAFEGDATGAVFANVDALLHNGPTPGVGHYFFTPEGMLVIAPLPDGVYRVTASIDPAEADRELTLADVQNLIDRRGRPGIGVRELRDSGWGIARIRIQARIAAAFRRGRLLLAGDAAHIYGPTGAQGMNGGIQDAHNLAWKLALVVAGRAGEGLLDTYAQERRAVARQVLHHVEQQTRMAVLRPAPLVAARDGLLRAATSTGLIDRRMAPTINQLDVAYDLPGPRPSRLTAAGRGVGRRLPDLELAGGGRLFPALAGSPYTLLALCRTPADATAADSLAAAVRARPYGDLVRLRTVWRTAPPDRPAALVDPGSTLHRRFGARSAGVLVLVRADQHVAAVTPLSDPAGVLALLDRQLRPAPAAASEPAATTTGRKETA